MTPWQAVLRRRWRLVVVGALVAVLVPLASLHLATAGDRFTVEEEVPPRPVALVLGAAVTAEGEPTPVLARRLDVAARLYRRGSVEAVLVSGNNTAAHHHETEAMRGYLLAAGLPAGQVMTDPAGFRTWDSCARAREVFGVRAAVVVTQDFHLPRALALCRAMGIDAVGVADTSLGSLPVVTLYGHLREVPAAGKALLDLVFRPAPAGAAARGSSSG
ncbi:SanA/YdcF family protein [Salinactinospora qingdaonensis]|uniref:ElyC/SanA/YdcF family protein n=1 Tax=Salinactinospora qingdaonensis TaxID=702744 RepID=A0ABP7FY95_9ACTN